MVSEIVGKGCPGGPCDLGGPGGPGDLYFFLSRVYLTTLSGLVG